MIGSASRKVYMHNFETIITEKLEGNLAVVRINRPKRRNALNQTVFDELVEALTTFDKDKEVHAIVLTGNDEAFASGADIHEMRDKTITDVLLAHRYDQFETMRRIKKPLIAAVSGYALGGGLEVVMLCDMVVASETATLGQAEITVGLMPGAGGTQRLTKQLGKALAMEVVLAGRRLSAEEALKYGLVNYVVPIDEYYDQAINLARKVASSAPLAVLLAKQAILKAQDLPLESGLAYERHSFYLLFGTEDKEEGIKAFAEKRSPVWRGR